jgi:hypothetical protein
MLLILYLPFTFRSCLGVSAQFTRLPFYALPAPVPVPGEGGRMLTGVWRLIFPEVCTGLGCVTRCRVVLRDTVFT